MQEFTEHVAKKLRYYGMDFNFSEQCAKELMPLMYGEYAPIIEGKDKQIAELKKSSEWISVSDRLPEDEGDYLIYRSKFKERFLARYSLADKTFNVFGQMKGVTHWMPLANKPQKEGL